jgi:hypothetical protein
MRCYYLRPLCWLELRLSRDQEHMSPTAGGRPEKIPGIGYPFDLGMAPRIGCHRRMERSNKPATNRAPPSLSPRSSSRISCHRQRCRRSRDVLGTSADPARRYARGARHSARHVPRRKKWRQAPKCARHAALGSSAEKVASLGRRSRPQPECREYTSLNL